MNFQIGRFKIGDNSPTLIVAEMSGNHCGSFDRAIKIIKAAKRAGANAIKLQTYTADTITLKSNKKDFLISKKSPWSHHKNLWNLYNHAYTPWKWQKKIFAKAKNIGLNIFSSPFDEYAVDFLKSLNCCAYKIASSEINHIPLLEKVAKTNKPVILSTGLASEKDIDLAIYTLKKNGAKKIVLLLCVSNYPATTKELNLRKINYFKRKYKVLVGLSDHTIGSVAATTSVSLGACLVEKHFNLQDNKKTVDSFFSCKEKDFKLMVKKIREVELALGNKNLKSVEKKILGKKEMRSIYICKDVRKGEKLTNKNIKVVRPGHSLHPKYFKKILGYKVKKKLKYGDRIKLNYLVNFKN